MSQTVFNPSAQNIQLNDGHTLKSDMSVALKNVVSSLPQAQRSSPHSLQPTRELAGLGAALSGGVGLALCWKQESGPVCGCSQGPVQLATEPHEEHLRSHAP
jgi:hypothetical protein